MNTSMLLSCASSFGRISRESPGITFQRGRNQSGTTQPKDLPAGRYLALSIQMQSKQQVCRRNPVCDSGFHHQVRAKRPHSRILRQYFFCVQVGALNLQISKIRFCVFNGLGECGEAQRLIEEPADCRGGYVRQPAEKTLIGKRCLAPERMESVARVFEGVPQSSA